MEVRELVERAAVGEEDAWHTFVERYGRLIWGLLRKFQNLESAALQDIAQEVFASLLNGGLKRFRGSTEHELRCISR
jgi:DNA-directed RNA polymerase specialized sigma24 family protein